MSKLTTDEINMSHKHENFVTG